MKKICIIAHDPITAEIAGPAIRTLEMARILSRHFAVTLAVPSDAPLLGEPFQIRPYSAKNIKALVADQDVVFVFGFLLHEFPFLKNLPACLVVDVYCPVFFEALESMQSKSPQGQVHFFRALVDIFNRQLLAGDFFLCASEKQRDMWAGMLMANGRINPFTFAQDKTLRSLIDVVPYGLPEEPPVKKKQVLKGVHPAIATEDKLLIWGGGLYNWLDPLTAIKAMDIIRRERSDVKLFFMGFKHPIADVKMDIVGETVRLSDSLGLTGKWVIFNERWVPYNERADYLLEADIGLSLHKQSIETDYSFRTRILDYLWVSLPILSTTGGWLSDWVEDKQLGRVVPYDDAEAVARAVLEMLADENQLEHFRNNIDAEKPRFYWRRVLEPVIRFCSAPVKKPDAGFPAKKWVITPPGELCAHVAHIYREAGLGVLIKRIIHYTLRNYPQPLAIAKQMIAFLTLFKKNPKPRAFRFLKKNMDVREFNRKYPEDNDPRS